MKLWQSDWLTFYLGILYVGTGDGHPCLRLMNPPKIPTDQWITTCLNRCMVPTELPPDILLAPEYLLKVTYCGCSSEKPCKTANCSCKKANVRCSDLCKCGGTCEGNGREESAADNSEEDNSDTESILYDESDNEEYWVRCVIICSLSRSIIAS